MGVNALNKFTKLIYRVLDSVKFFWVSLGVLFINASWIAFTGLYPMAHDEQFHLGLIRLYSEKLLPFWTSMPPGEATYGALTRDPSYIYHYVLSFPYRVLEIFVKSEVGQVITLRFVSILFVLVGVYVFRKIILSAGFSRVLTHFALLILAITPLVPFFAAQINYDPLVFLMLACSVRMGQKILDRLRSSKKLDAKEVGILLVFLMFGSLVKYAFLPVALAVVSVIAWNTFKQKLTFKKLWVNLIKSGKKLTGSAALVIAGSVIILFGLNVERYVVNTVKYRTPTPECDQVLSVDECMAYSPWRRNYLTNKSFQEGRLQTRYTSRNFPRYATTIWLSKTTEQLFFSISGSSNNYKIARPYRAPRLASVALMLTGLVLFVWQYRQLNRAFKLDFMLAVPLVYVGALLSQNYLDFLHIGYPYAIQGRYLVPILPIAYILIGQSFASGLSYFSFGKHVKSIMAAVAILLFTSQGGGAGTFITRSNPEWWWPNNTVINMNQTAQKILNPITVGR